MNLIVDLVIAFPLLIFLHRFCSEREIPDQTGFTFLQLFYRSVTAVLQTSLFQLGWSCEQQLQSSWCEQ